MAITDSLSHPPGADYNTDVRPGIGNTFHDPVFNENVLQLTPRNGTAVLDDIYAHCWANANGTYIFEGSGSNSTLNVRSVPSGTVVLSNVFTGSGITLGATDVIWHPTNPDKYFFLDQSFLKEGTVSGGGTSITVHNFGTTLQFLGGSVNWVDKTGRYFVIRWSDTGKVYDRQTDTVYSGSIPPPDLAGWFGMSPSAKHVLAGASAPNFHTSFLINHGAQTVDTVGIKFWDNDGDHGVPVSGSDGKDYVIVADSNSTQGLYRVDVTLDQNGRTEAQQVADAFLLLDNIGFDEAMHASHGPNGGQDWVFVSVEDAFAGGDDFNGPTSPWFRFKQEIIAINYLTGVHRRLASHRSRNLNLSYYYFPRVSSAWDASLVMWASNFNIQTPANYTDIYAVQNPLGTSVASYTPTPVPVPSRRMASWVRRPA